MAGFETWASFAGLPSRSATAGHALTFNPDHPTGAGHRIVCRFYGFDGTGRKTLEEVGAEYQVTRERIRQISEKFSRRVRGKRVNSPVLHRARSVLERKLPALEQDIQKTLREENIITEYFDCTGLLAALSIFDQPSLLRITNLEGVRVVGGLQTLDALKRAPAIARTIVSASGCGHLEHVMGDMEIATEQMAARHVALTLLESLAGLSWLNEQKEWFTIADAKRNRLANIIRKILFVSPDVSLSEMRGALQRVRRLAGFSPPRAILRAFCKTLPFCRVNEDEDRVKATTEFAHEVILGDNEMCLFEVLRDFGPAMHISAIRNECLRRGMNANSFYVYLGNSPIVCRLAPQMYALVGALILPGTIENLQLQKTSRAPVRLDNGWLSDGRLWLSYRLNVSNIRAGAFSMPSGMREIADGEYFIQSADTGSRNAIMIEAGRLSGLRRPLAILGAEEDDIVRLILDPRTRQAEVTFSEDFLETAIEHLAEPPFRYATTSNGNARETIPIEPTQAVQEHAEWQPISTAPTNKDLEVRLADSSGRYALLFPCRHLPDGAWLNSWLLTPLAATPVEWREWTEKPFEF